MFTKLAIWFLRKREVSVLINFHLDGGKLTQLKTDGFFYDNKLNDCVVQEQSNPELPPRDIYLLDGKFKYKLPPQKAKVTQLPILEGQSAQSAVTKHTEV